MGAIVAAVGIGVILTIVVPLWGWIFAGGLGLVYCGWYIMNHHHH